MEDKQFIQETEAITFASQTSGKSVADASLTTSMLKSMSDHIEQLAHFNSLTQ